jgi:alpha-tubulin suppressor-like RCC1 family protein
MRKAALLALIAAFVLPSCRSGVSMWDSCDESPGVDRTGTDGVYVLVCRDGHWEPLGTVAEYVLASQGQPITWADVPVAPTTTTTTPPTTTPPTTTTTTTATVPVTTSFASVSGGQNHTCGVTVAGGVKCWGQNTYGQLGNAGTAGSLTPVDVSVLTSGVASVSAGAYHTCAVTIAGGVKCWGDNTYGQLGNAGTAGSLTPVDVSGLTSGVASVSAGGYHTCAVTTAGAARCWGHNTYGQLGNGTTVASSSPVDVSGLTSGVAAVDGGYYQTCAVTTGAGLKCWGDNTNGQLGNGTTVASSSPVGVSGLTSGVAAMSGGANDSCAVTTGGPTKCWGRNTFGQAGNGTTAIASTPVDVVG